MTEINEVWAMCTTKLRQEIPGPAWKAWVEPVVLIEANPPIYTCAAPNSMVREVVMRRFDEPVRRALADVTGTESPVLEVVVQPQALLVPTGPVAPPAQAPYSDAPQEVPHAYARANDVDTQRRNERRLRSGVFSHYTFDNFIVGDFNRFAQAAAHRVAEEPARAYNPLFIYGTSGLGKTHLLHAIGHYVCENFPALSVCYVSTETFLNDFIDSIRTKGQTAFKRRYRAFDVLLVDDIEFLEGKKETQEEFFHTFNSFYEAEKQIVISSDRPPRDIATLEDRLRSRFESGLITDIQPPELETRLAILRKKAEGERVVLPEEVLELIATCVKDNIRELEGALNRLSAFAMISDEPVTLKVAEKVLSDVIAASAPKQITTKEILEKTAAAFDLSIEEICGPSRRRPLVAARQTAMYLLRELTDSSYPGIAKVFGGRDHTTVIHAHRKITRLMGEKRQVYEQVTDLIRKIRSTA